MHSVIAFLVLLGYTQAAITGVCRCGKLVPIKYDIMTTWGPMCHTINTGEELRSFVPTPPWNPDHDLGPGLWKVVNGQVQSTDGEWLCDPGIQLQQATPPPPPPLPGSPQTIIVNVDDKFEFYYNGDKKLDDGGDPDWVKPRKTTFPVDTTQPVVFAIKGMDVKGVGGILSTGTGPVPFVTSPTTWKCSTQYDPNWNQVDFDDTKWSVATQFDNNLSTKQVAAGGAPYIKDQSTQAGWIWTSDRKFHNTVYCRFTNWCFGKNEGDSCGKSGRGFVCLKNPAGAPVLYCGPPASCNKGKPSTHGWGAPNMQALNAYVNVDNSFTLYVNGKLVVTDNGNPNWAISHYATTQIDANKPLVLAIEGVDQGGPGGIIASFSGAVTINTDDMYWKCSTTAEPGWNDVGFDDSCWKPAHTYGINRNAPKPWGKSLSKLAQGAEWIWVDNHVKEHQAFCRVQVPKNLYGTQQNIIVNGDNSFMFYYNGVMKLRDQDSGAWKTPQMTSFPVDTTQPILFAVQGVDLGGPGGLLMTGTGVVNFVSSSAWKCSDTLEKGWNMLDFDDSKWSSAEAYGANANGANTRKYYVKEQDNKAEWIWTDDANLHNTVYCRYLDYCYGKKAGDACGPNNAMKCVANPTGMPALICSHPTACNAPATPTDWQNNGNMAYLFNPNPLPAMRAMKWCGTQGAMLTYVHNDADNKFLMQMAQGRSTAAGAYLGIMAGKNGKWMAGDGTNFDYGVKPGQAPWKTGQPAKGMMCAGMELSSGMWMGANCKTPMPFFCSRSAVPITKTVTATVNVDNTFQFYYNGVKMIDDGGNGAWATPHTKSFPVTLNQEIVFAIAGKDLGGPGGAIASVTGGVFSLTKPNRWKCTDQTPPPGWTKPGFDDSCWNWAHNYGLNRANPKPWGSIKAQQPGAYWIWTDDHNKHEQTWCRTVVSGDERMPAEEVFVNVDNSFNLYYNGKKVLSDRGSKDWKTTNQVTFPVDTTKPAVFAFQGIDKGGPGGAVITGKGPIPFVTSPQSWKCSFRYQKGWNLPGFDDSNWARATSYGKNGGTPAPAWGKMSLQDPNAHWIWTDDSKLHNTVYCRWVDYCYGKAKGEPCAAYKGATCVPNPDAGAAPALVCGHPASCTKGPPSTAAKGAPKWKTVTAKFNVDNTYKAYYNGQIFSAPKVGNWKTTMTDTVKVDFNKPIVFAITGIDVGGPGGIMASFTGPMFLTTSTQWKCNTEEVPGWNNIGFDDSCWPRAHNYGVNRYNPKPWLTRKNADPGAAWIWTNDHNKHNKAYCRIEVPASALQQFETIYINADNAFTLYYNGVKKLTDGGAIGWGRTYKTSFPIDPNVPFVIAVNGVDKGGPGAMLITGTGPFPFVSNDAAWLCSEDLDKGWNTLGFDDSDWSLAQSYGTNGVKPWNKIGNGQSTVAQWIWTDDHKLHNNVGCRLSNPCVGKNIGDKCGKNKAQTCQANKATPGNPAMVCAPPVTGCGKYPQPTASVGPPSLKPVTAKMNIDNTGTLYYNGVLVLKSHPKGWPSTAAKTFMVDTNKPVVLAIAGIDLGGPGGILASFSGALGNIVTQPSRWKCNTAEIAGWNDIGFDDHCWPKASSYGRNGAAPWKKRGANAANAYWIWTKDHNNHNKAYCRFQWNPK